MPSRFEIVLPLAALVAALWGTSAAGAQGNEDPLSVLKPLLDADLRGTEGPAAEAPAEPSGSGQSGVAPPDPEQDVPQPTDTDAAGARSNTGSAGDSPTSGAPESPGEKPPDGDGQASGNPDAAPPTPPIPPVEASRPLRFGVIAGRDLPATMARIEPVADDLGRILDRAVELLPMSSYGAMIDAQVQRRIDGGFYSTLAYALAERECRCLEPIAAPTASDGTAAYHAVVVAPRDSAISSPADLESRVVAAGAADSIGNRRMQIAGLLADGIDPGRFAAVRDAESGADAVRLMLSGSADAAFAWTSLAGEQDAGYSRGTLAELVSAGEMEMSEVSIVWRSPAIPHGPFAVLDSLPDADKGRIETYLLGLDTANPAAYDALNPLFSGGYVPVEPADYEPLGVLLDERIDDLSRPAAPPAEAGVPVTRAAEEDRKRP